MKIYDVSRLPSSITLGWDGENNWRPIAFDCSSFLTGRSDAVVTLWLLPKGEAQAFPVALERDGNTVIWTPLNEEMTAERGQLQIVVQDGTDVGKSKVIDYTVHDSLVGGADHPAETPSWAVQVVADVTEQADRAEEAAESIGESIGEQLPGAIADYLEEHPVTVTETDPTVPSWAKQPNKPTYTAAEVGAMPDSYTPPVTSVNGKTGAVTLSASDVHALPDDTVIPAAVTEQTVSGWGFTKNTGTYSKPAGGIPASDLADGVIPDISGKQDAPLIGSVGDSTAADYVTPTQVYNALLAGKDVIINYSDMDFQDVYFTAWGAGLGMVAASINSHFAVDVVITLTGTISNNSWSLDSVALVDGNTLAAVATSGSYNDLTNKPTIPTVPTAVSQLTNDSGFQTAAQVQTAIANAAELPSGGSAGDFLRKTVSGVAWETVPSAESASFGGGS